MSNDLIDHVLENYEWREYEWIDEHNRIRIYTIIHPVHLYYRPGGETHRILDNNGVVHIVPAPGVMGCAIRYKKNEMAQDQVKF